jgi:hypothetical protein
VCVGELSKEEKNYSILNSRSLSLSLDYEDLDLFHNNNNSNVKLNEVIFQWKRFSFDGKIGEERKLLASN